MIRITMRALAEKQKEVMLTLLSLSGQMRKDQGCQRFTAFQEMGNPNLLGLLSEWRTRKDADLHLRSDKFRVLLGTRGLLGEPARIQIHTVSNSEGMGGG